MEEAGVYTGKWDFVTFFVVPGATLWLACREDWLDSNISVIGNSPGMELWLYAWGMFVSSYSFFYIRYLFSLGGYEGIKGRGFLYTACILLAISVWIPYDPDFFLFFSCSFIPVPAFLFKRKDPLRSQPVSSDALAVCRACGSGSCTVVCLRLYHRPFGSVCNHCLLWISGFG